MVRNQCSYSKQASKFIVTRTYGATYDELLSESLT